MIVIENVSKQFDKTLALDNVSMTVNDKSVFGLIGTNGAGKSTLLRIISGILRPGKGSVSVDGRTVFGHTEVSEEIFYISDDQFFFSNDTPGDMMRFYKGFYPMYDTGYYKSLVEYFELPVKNKIRTYSKGMKKQLFVALGLASGARYLLCDETFDGLDPLMREKVKGLLKRDMETRGLTPVIASHSLRELQDICDQMVMLHKGGVVDLKEDLASASGEDISLVTDGKVDDQVTKVHIIPKEGSRVDDPADLEILSHTLDGRIHTMIVRGREDEVMEKLRLQDPFFLESVPMTLEEMFIAGLGHRQGDEKNED